MSPPDLFVEFIIPRWLLFEGLKQYNEVEAWVHSDEDVVVRRVCPGCWLLVLGSVLVCVFDAIRRGSGFSS